MKHLLTAAALALLLPPAFLLAVETNLVETAEQPAPVEGELNLETLEQVEVPETPALKWLTYGGDLRLRYESFDHLPSPSALGDYWSYFRIRTRAFIKAEHENFTFYTRAVNEWRKLANDHGRNSYPFPDELIFDQLYVEYRNLFNAPLRLRAGRQDLMFGSLRVLSEGTPGDGSRSFYFDAVRLTWTPVNKLDIDAFGIYNRWYDQLAIGGLDGDIIRDHKRDLTGNRSDESGAGLYLTDKRSDILPYELYYLWKHETTDSRGAIAGGVGRDIHTFGTRLLPNFTDHLAGEFELAGQLGRTEDSRDIHAFMLYGGLTWSLDTFRGVTPYVTGAAIMLSGDSNEATGDISAWDPVWGRLPAFGDLSGMVYPGMSFWYQNLIYPHLELGFFDGPTKERSYHLLRFQTGPMFAQHEYGSDIPAVEAGSSHYRGWHVFSQYSFPIRTQPLGPLQKLFGRIEADCILPGDYYEESSPIYFLRLELLASF